jgi:hypothetical protein
MFMPIFSDQTVELLEHSQGNYQPSDGYLGAYYDSQKIGFVKNAASANKTYWFSCRETFHNCLDKRREAPNGTPDDERLVTDGYFFCSALNRAEDVVDLIDRAEDQLKLSTRTQFSRTTFKNTNDPRVIYLKPPYFWWKENMRHQIFTILLRAGLLHSASSKNSLIDVVYKHPYAMATRAAVEHFFKGNTHFCGDQGQVGKGWRDYFLGNFRSINPLTMDEIEKVLVPPENAPTSPVTLS